MLTWLVSSEEWPLGEAGLPLGVCLVGGDQDGEVLRRTRAQQPPSIKRRHGRVDCRRIGDQGAHRRAGQVDPTQLAALRRRVSGRDPGPTKPPPKVHKSVLRRRAQR
jgi:hypothetical protein